jgi:general nucleoside transport system permease protein
MIFSTTMLAQTVRMTVPYACAGIGGVLSERSGVVNIALEGIMLGSALASVAVHHATGSALAGIAAGVATGATIGLVHALLVVHRRIDAIVSGIAINLIAAGGTRALLRTLYGSSSNSPSVAGIRLDIALLDPFFVATLVLFAACAWMLTRTRFGLRLRACGEDPAAAQAVGVRVTATRTLAVMLGGAICGLGGTALAYDLHQFQAGMTAGRGFIALAAVILSGWRAWPALFACIAFAALDATQIVLQNETRVPTQLLSILPYVATLVAMALVFRKASEVRPPAGLARHPD